MGLKCYILSEKQKKANDLGIDLRVDGNMSGIELSAIDICTILSNVIDNAIEAVEQTDGEKYIDISFKKHKDYLFICEKNPCNTKPKIEDNCIFSTKKVKENHGFGLLNIKEAVAKYDGDVNLKVNENEEGYEFSIEIILWF